MTGKFDFFNDAFADASRESWTKKASPELIKFEKSFPLFGKSLPISRRWTLFTGEGRFGTKFLDLVLAAKAGERGAIVPVPMQLSTSWHLGAALHFAVNGAGVVGGLVALHHRAVRLTEPFPDGNVEVARGGEILAHLLQELGGPDPNMANECEILLQPGLRMRYERTEVVYNVPVCNLTYPHAVARTLAKLEVHHVEILSAKDLGDDYEEEEDESE
jgi:hypothetical protein